MKSVTIECDQIDDWNSFHTVFQKAFGFPNFYGRNMNAWIDCLTCLDDADAGMTQVTIEPGELVVIELRDAEDFKKRCSDQFDALIECTADVNCRRGECGDPPVIAILLT